MTDPIADMLARIRNAVSAKHSRVDIPASKLKLEIARILKEEGYINNFVIKGEGAKKVVRIFCDTTRAALLRSRTWARVSRPGRRVYVGSHEIPARARRLWRQHCLDFARLMSGKTARKENVAAKCWRKSIKN
jgi:small subunit ribosomal protein S8